MGVMNSQADLLAVNRREVAGKAFRGENQRVPLAITISLYPAKSRSLTPATFCNLFLEPFLGTRTRPLDVESS